MSNSTRIIEIPQYIRQVKFSEAQRPVYWEWNGQTIKAKSKKLLQKFINPACADNIVMREGDVIIDDLRPEYALGVYRADVLISIRYPDGRIDELRHSITWNKAMREATPKHILIDATLKEKVIANTTKVGTPRIEIIRGQDFYNNRIQEHARGTVIQAIKRSFVDYCKDIEPVTSYPVRVKCYLYDTVKNVFDGNLQDVAGGRWDVGNRVYPYAKAFLDLLSTGRIGDEVVMEPKLFDDDRLHVTEDPQGGVFCPIENEANRKLVFVIAKDDVEFKNVIADIEAERLLLIQNCKHYGTAETV